jgi:TRAP-type C4-dicarboxylate transport system permease small subunit
MVATAQRRRARPWPERLLGPIAAFCLFGMMALTFASVIARYFLNRPIAGDSELQGFMLGLIIFAALPLVTFRQRHIAVRSFAALLTGRALVLQRAFVLVVTTAGLTFIAYLLFLQGKTLAEEHSMTNYLDIPEAPFAYFFAALALVAAALAAALFRDLSAREEGFEEIIAAETGAE